MWWLKLLILGLSGESIPSSRYSAIAADASFSKFVWSSFRSILQRNVSCLLTHWGRVTHICVGNLTIIGSDNGLIVAWTAPSHYLNQCWNIVNWTLRNKLQWNFNRNSNIFIQQNALQNGVCEMASILSRPQCVNQCHAYLSDVNDSIHKSQPVKLYRQTNRRRNNSNRNSAWNYRWYW